MTATDPPPGAPVAGRGPAWQPTAALETLRRRADLVERTRAFFRARGVFEADTPVLQGGANLDHGVVPFSLETGSGRGFLPTSPEHPLKRLIASGSGDVWTLAPAFRRGERGRLHAPEFRMLEWYRVGWDDRRLLGEVIELLAMLGDWSGAHEILTWREAFRRHAGLDPATAGDDELYARLAGDAAVVRGDRRAALDLLLTRDVEPWLGRGCWTALVDYPAEASAQARLRPGEDGAPVAARFELYRDGIELANGYHELTDATELQTRLDAELTRRDAGEAHDQRFAAAMSAGLPDCAGVAVGFDRVVMLALGLDSVAATQAFSWDAH
jgi:lysyl-tRNA synthetase class 2